MDSNSSHASKIRAVVRGECEYIALRGLGLKINRYDDVWEIENPKNIYAEVEVKDVAEGLIHFKGDPVKLQTWASFVLASSSFIGLESLSALPHGEHLVEALWDAAFEGRVAEKAVSMANEITSSD